VVCPKLAYVINSSPVESTGACSLLIVESWPVIDEHKLRCERGVATGK
jgi:hypothetical protein